MSISTLATFPAVKNLSPDLEFIKQALRGSEQLELDPSENKVTAVASSGYRHNSDTSTPVGPSQPEEVYPHPQRHTGGHTP